MVVANIHGSDTAGQGTTVWRARITPSSQGCGKILAMV